MPDTDPNSWFLPASGSPRSPHFTSGNEVIALIDGEAYFKHLFDRMAAMVSSDYFHVAGWRISPSVLLEPATHPPSKAFLDQVKDLVTRGIVVRALLWYLPTAAFVLFYRAIPVRRFNHVKDNIDFVTGLNAVAWTSKSGSAAILDQRLAFPFASSPMTFASHHQKNVILSSGGHDWAYVGSIDLAVDRWDTNLHDGSSSRQKEYWDAYHDIQCVLQGPAVGQIWESFQQRWNDPTTPIKGISPVPPITPAPIKGKPPSAATYGTKHVQVLRTLACGSVYSFAPHGEQTPRMALELAIDKAQHYIYIEEQFLWPCSLVDKLHSAVARNPGLKVVILLARDLEFGPPLSTCHYEMRDDAIRSITGASTGQVFVYQLEQPASKQPIYVHPKLLIIDDCFVGIGSANINKRSLTTDTELHLGIIDGTLVDGTINGSKVKVCRFAKELRISLWGEHLGVTDPIKLEDPIAAIALWPDWSKSTPRAPSRVHQTVCYHSRSELATLLDWLTTLRAISSLKPPAPLVGIDIDRAIQILEDANTLLQRSGIDVVELALGPAYLLLKKFLKDFVMNVETTC